MFDKDDLSIKFCWAIAILATLFRLGLSLTQYATIYPPLAPLDDDLMTRAAMSITAGQWLGAYNCLTISKHAGFAVWLAFLHSIKIPYLVGNMAVWAMASALAAGALAPAVKRNWGKLAIYLSLLYNPAASAQYATRVYRDSLFPRLCVMFFSGIVGAALRHKKKLSSQLPWMLLYGAVFGRIYLFREDGIWVMPFFFAALATVLVIDRKSGRAFLVRSTLVSIAPFVLGALLIAAYCRQNQKYYGRFIVSDFDSGEFKAAYGAMTSLEQDSWDPQVAVPEDVRQDLYRNIEMFAGVEEALKEPLLMNGYYDKSKGDFRSGAFYWALRSRLDSMGVYRTPQKAREYYEELTAEIQKAVDEGRLRTTDGSTKLRRSVTPPIRAEYIAPVLAETWNGFRLSILFKDCDPLAERAVGIYEEEIRPVEEYINQKGAVALIENTETPYLSPARQLTHGIMRAIRAVYSVLIPVMTVVALIRQIKKLMSDIQLKRVSPDSLLNVVLLGFIGMALLRSAMIAFMEVSSFGIGTYVMYLSTVHPLIILYAVTGTVKSYEY